MKVTNVHNLPEVFRLFMSGGKYSKGDADFSVTELMDSPRIRLLREKHKDEMEMDLSERVFALLGTAVHEVLENYSHFDHISEERLFTKLPHPNEPDKTVTVSGAIDQQIPNEDGTMTIQDFKVCSVWAVIFGKVEWEEQLNAYAYLVEQEKGIKVSKLQIVAVLRDWKQREAKLKPDYPDAPVKVIDVPLWPFEKRMQFMEDRLIAHVSAEDELPLCTDKERWARPASYAVMKKGRRTALRVMATRDEAEKWLAYNGRGQTQPAYMKTHYIERREGEAVRCEANYCGVAEFCSQFKGQKVLDKFERETEAANG